ncbi:MAG: hypothetical protein IT379_09155 [Deltaproteobacteria bacterium]|nr:hypothetical protein [Deltaproteobacteria bacterium]
MHRRASASAFALAISLLACGDDDALRTETPPPQPARDDGAIPPSPERDASSATDASTDGDGGSIAPAPPIDGGADATPTTPPGVPPPVPVPPPPPAGEPLFVAVGYGGHRTRSIDGLAWTDHVVEDPEGGDDPRLLRGVGYGDGLFVAVGNRVLVSRDGVEWTERAYPSESFVSDAVWLDGTWAAAGGNGLRMRSIDGGETWGDETGYFAGHYRAIAAGNGRFLAVGHTYGDAVEGLSSVSLDGATWSAERTGGASLRAIAFGAGVFVAVGDRGRVMVTPDGESIVEHELGTDALEDVAFVDGEHVVVASGGTWRSRDGDEWRRDEHRVPGGLEHGVGRYVAAEWPGRIVASDDLVEWTTVSETGPALTDIVFGHVVR